MQISSNGELLISINGKTKLLSKEEIVKLYNQDINSITINDTIKDNYPYFVSHTAENYPNSETSGDTIVDEVREKFLERSKVGQNKYNNNLDRSDLSLKEWQIHLQEELMDATLYLTKLIRLANEK